MRSFASFLHDRGLVPERLIPFCENGSAPISQHAHLSRPLLEILGPFAPLRPAFRLPTRNGKSAMREGRFCPTSGTVASRRTLRLPFRAPLSHGSWSTMPCSRDFRG